MPSSPEAQALAQLPDEQLLDAVQRQTVRYFWEGAEPASGLARDRSGRRDNPANDLVTTGGSGFGIQSLIVAAERGWIARADVLDRLEKMLDLLSRAERHHGALPHFMHGVSGVTIPFSATEDGGDLVETAFLCLGLLCARQYFDRDTTQEERLRGAITALWEQVEWDWYTQGGRHVLYWHWSPRHQWAMNHEIRGWNECLLAYVLAAASPTHPVDPVVYTEGFAAGPAFLNGASYFGIPLPLGPPLGGPLFFCHYSFCGLDPRRLNDQYASYWQQCVAHVQINRAHCIDNPGEHKGYGESCWGLTASDEAGGYSVHAPDVDNGTITPTAAISSMPYAPIEALQAMRGFLSAHGDKVWGRFGFVDAFCEDKAWFADTFLAIDQGPMVVMIENHRTGLLWKLLMRDPDVQNGLRRLGFN